MVQAQTLSIRKALSFVLITLGALGYVIAGGFLCYAAYFWVVGTLHPNAPEDTSAGLAGLGFILEAGTGVLIGGIASIFFIPGMILRGKIKESTKTQLEQNSTVIIAGSSDRQFPKV